MAMLMIHVMLSPYTYITVILYDAAHVWYGEY